MNNHYVALKFFLWQYTYALLEIHNQSTVWCLLHENLWADGMFYIWSNYPNMFLFKKTEDKLDSIDMLEGLRANQLQKAVW